MRRATGRGVLWPHDPSQIAWSTFAVNVAGGFLLGLLMVFVSDVWPPHRYVRPFLGVGVLGGFTTFSTYMLDTHAIFVAGRPSIALLYLVGTRSSWGPRRRVGGHRRWPGGQWPSCGRGAASWSDRPRAHGEHRLRGPHREQRRTTDSEDKRRPQGQEVAMTLHVLPPSG